MDLIGVDLLSVDLFEVPLLFFVAVRASAGAAGTSIENASSVAAEALRLRPLCRGNGSAAGFADEDLGISNLCVMTLRMQLGTPSSQTEFDKLTLAGRFFFFCGPFTS